MIIPISELKNHEFSLSDINCIHQKPSYRLLKNRGRHFNGFLYITEGAGTYESADGIFSIAPGALVYLPLGSVHTLTVVSERIEFYRINFTLHIGGETALFSRTPLLVNDAAPQECADAIRALAQDFRVETSTVLKNEKMCTIFSSMQESSSHVRQEKLSPAIRHIHEHLTEHVDCRELAALCYLSMAQFYNLFRSEFGMAPLEYRSSLLLRRAEMLLEEDGLSVAEVSAALGFESAAYFSRFFKKNTGLSPSDYRNKQREKL